MRTTHLPRAIRSSIVIVILALQAPGVAGPETDPEISSICGNPGIPTTDSLDICAGWFGAEWRLVPRQDDPAKKTWAFKSLVTTLQVEREMDSRPAYGRYALGWEIDGCEMLWSLVQPVDSGEWRVRFSHCGEGNERVYHIVPDQRVTIGTDRISVRLDLESELAQVAESFSLGAELEDLYAKTLIGLESQTLQETVTYSFDYAEGSRSFVIGQDRPDDPED